MILLGNTHKSCEAVLPLLQMLPSRTTTNREHVQLTAGTSEYMCTAATRSRSCQIEIHLGIHQGFI